MNIAIEELGGIIADFVRVGYNSAVADYDPPQDRLRLSEVKKWLKFRHVEFKTFQTLVDNGLQGCCRKLSFGLFQGGDTESLGYNENK